MALKMVAFIDPARCDKKPACPVYRSCPAGAVSYAGGNVTIAAEKCLGCGICTSACPRRAVDLTLRA